MSCRDGCDGLTVQCKSNVNEWMTTQTRSMKRRQGCANDYGDFSVNVSHETIESDKRTVKIANLNRIWIAGIATAYDDQHCELSKCLYEETDIGQALELLKLQYLNNGNMTLNELGTLMLGLSRVVVGKSRLLNTMSNSMYQIGSKGLVGDRGPRNDQRENYTSTTGMNINHNDGDVNICLSSNGSNQIGQVENVTIVQCFNINDSKVEKNEQVLIDKRRRTAKRKKLQLDTPTQLKVMTTNYCDQRSISRMIPNLGLSTKAQLKYSLDSDDLMAQPIRRLCPTLAYLALDKQHAAISKAKRQKSLTHDRTNRMATTKSIPLDAGDYRSSVVNGSYQSSVPARNSRRCVSDTCGKLTRDIFFFDQTFDLIASNKLYLPPRLGSLSNALENNDNKHPYCDSSSALKKSTNVNMEASIKSILFTDNQRTIKCFDNNTKKRLKWRAIRNQFDQSQSKHTHRMLRQIIDLRASGITLIDLDHLICLASHGNSATKQQASIFFHALLQLDNRNAIKLKQLSPIINLNDFLIVPKIVCFLNGHNNNQ